MSFGVVNGSNVTKDKKGANGCQVGPFDGFVRIKESRQTVFESAMFSNLEGLKFGAFFVLWQLPSK